jgi:hypothetical protein
MPWSKIVSGGQTGVDCGALDAALDNGFPCGGFCPAGRKAEDGRIAGKYPLTELPAGGYQQRTLRNVIASDGTLIVYRNLIEGGTQETLRLCIEHSKPYKLIDSNCGHSIIGAYDEQPKTTTEADPGDTGASDGAGGTTPHSRAHPRRLGAFAEPVERGASAASSKVVAATEVTFPSVEDVVGAYAGVCLNLDKPPAPILDQDAVVSVLQRAQEQYLRDADVLRAAVNLAHGLSASEAFESENEAVGELIAREFLNDSNLIDGALATGKGKRTMPPEEIVTTKT